MTTIFPTELIRLARDDFEGFLERHPELRDVIEAKLEERRVASLVAEATPGAGNVLSELIREEVVMGTDALIIDNHKCIRCNNCLAACEGVHDDGQARLSLTGISFYNLLAPNSCWQCEDPLCMLDCPPDAIARDPSGEVFIKASCIGCGNCESNCPYGNIFMVHPRPAPSLGAAAARRCSAWSGGPGRAARRTAPARRWRSSAISAATWATTRRACGAARPARRSG